MHPYKYYVALDIFNKPIEVYRGDNVGYAEFTSAGLWRAKKDGTWSDHPDDTTWVCNRMMQGDFDPEENEISESEAIAYLKQWRAGHWPGRE